MDNYHHTSGAVIAGDRTTAAAASSDDVACALIKLMGATERLLMLLKFQNGVDYELGSVEPGMKAVEHAMAEYRAKVRRESLY